MSDRRTVQEYCTLEVSKGIKYEFHNGAVFAMAGGSYHHGLLYANMYTELRNQLKGKDCKPLSSEIKLDIAARNSYVHPDAMVICGPIEHAEEDSNVVINPVLIVEVLSKSTTDYDQGNKFHLYRQLPSFQEYVLVDQYQKVVEVYYSPPGVDLWKISRYEGQAAQVNLESIGVSDGLEDFYFEVEID